MTGIEKMIKGMRDDGWDDYKIWLHRKFTSHHFSSKPCDPCQWCGSRHDGILYLVPGITADGKKNWICMTCGMMKYGGQIEEEMDQYAHL